jgi:nucleotide-binding universal stress UspA family protein
MSIKTILAAASGGSASDGCVELACRLARRFDAEIEAYHVRTDPLQVLIAAGAGYGMPLAGEFIDQLNADAAALASKTRTAFEAAAARHQIPAADLAAKRAGWAWREEAGYAPDLVARRARFFDLVVLGRSERVADQAHSDAVEQTLMHSGRPVLLAPAEVPAVFAETIAIGWNGSPQAVRVIAATLPLLAAAKSLTIIGIGESHDESATSLIDYLGWHGIAAKHHGVPPVTGVGAGEQLLSTARDDGADLLIMGGYGHRPWREFLFGGATREIVGVSLLPILLAH